MKRDKQNYSADVVVRRRVNVKVLVAMIGSLVVLGAGTHFLHAYQIKRNSILLLQQAQQAEAEGALDQAILYYRAYLGFVPSDDDALASYALALLKQARKRPQLMVRALNTLERAVSRNPHRPELRRELASGWFETRDFALARDHLKFLLREVSPADAALEFQLGRCHLYEGNFRSCAEDMARAVRHDPNHIEAHWWLATMQRSRHEEAYHVDQNGKSELLEELVRGLTLASTCPPATAFPAAISWAALYCSALHPADRTIHSLVATNDSNYRAWVVRWRYRKMHGMREAAATDLVRAMELAPEEAEVLLSAAEEAKEDEHLDRARKYLQRGLERFPKDRRIYEALIELERQSSRFVEAIAVARQGVRNLAEMDRIIMTMILGDVLIDANQPAEAAEVLASLRSIYIPPGPVQYLEARLAMRNAEWTRAAHLLEDVRPRLMSGSVFLAIQINLHQAFCYERLGNREQELAACRRAVALDPLWAPSRLALAEAQIRMGLVDEAIRELRVMAPIIPGARNRLVHLMVMKNLRRPEADRDWQRVDRALDAPSQGVRDPVADAYFRALTLVAQQRLEAAREEMEATREAYPERIEVWAFLADLLERQKKFAEAGALLDEADRQVRDRASVRLLRVRYWARQGGPAALAALARLAEGMEDYTTDARHMVRESLSYAYINLGEFEKGREILLRLTEEKPFDLNLRVNLFDAAYRTDTTELLDRMVSELRKIEGRSGSWWRYCAALHLLRTARKSGSRQGLDEARILLQELNVRRPGWVRTALLDGELADLRGDVDQAIEKYKLTADMGDRRPIVISRLIVLLSFRNRHAEVKAALRMLPETMTLKGTLGRAAVGEAFRDGDTALALTRARAAVAGSQEAEDHGWFGEILWAVGQAEEAEKAFAEAVRLDPKKPEGWAALVTCRVYRNRKPEAQATIVDAEKALPEKERALTLARCHEVAGNRERAEALFKEALTTRPDDVAAQLAAGNFYMRTGRHEQGEVLFRKVIAVPEAPEEHLVLARRGLAYVLAASKDPSKIQEGLALVEQNLKSKLVLPDDQRAKAVLLATDPRRRPEAIALLEQQARGKTIGAKDLFILARMQEDEGNWQGAYGHFLTLLGMPEGDQAVYLASFVGSLLRRSKLEEAQAWLDKLEVHEPTSPQTLGFKVQVLKGLDRKAEAVALLRKHAKRFKPEELAPLLEEVDEFRYAEAKYREYHKEAKRPESVFPLIGFLERRKNFAEALNLCEQAWRECPVELAARASVAVVSGSGAAPEHFQRVSDWLEPAVKKAPDKVELWVQLATLRYLQGKYTEAAQHYRTVLSRSSLNGTARNNLAWILVMHGNQPEEARVVIQEAIDKLGLRAELLSTRGVIYLRQGKTKEAIADLQRAVADEPTPSGYLHLTNAHLAARERSNAADAWRKALAAGLDAEKVDPLERKTYEEVAREFN